MLRRDSHAMSAKAMTGTDTEVEPTTDAVSATRYPIGLAWNTVLNVMSMSAKIAMKATTNSWEVALSATLIGSVSIWTEM